MRREQWIRLLEVAVDGLAVAAHTTDDRWTREHCERVLKELERKAEPLA